MKLNITIQPYELNGYLNISPLKGENIWQLSAEPAECMEIIAEDIVDYIPNADLENVVKNYVSKLRHGGKIILGGTDVFEVSKRISMQSKDISELNQLIYGVESPTGWGFKRGISSIIYISSLLSQLGLRITKQRLNDCQYIVEAYRN